MAYNSSHGNTAQAVTLGTANITARLLIKEEDFGVNGDGGSDNDVYRPRPQLPQPFVVMRRLADLIKDLDAGMIDVDPEYQREVVWTAERMTGLVNSLIENFYIPPIILNRKTLPSDSNMQKHTLVCVDGKQRLSSIRAFIKGMIPCHDHVGDKWWFSDESSTRRKKILPENTRKLFLAKEFVSFEFKNLSAHQEEELFARVQMGVQLTLAEKMRASSGPWQELARLFVDDFPDIFALMKDRTRAKDFQLALACFSQIVEVMHPSSEDGVPVFKQTHTALPKLLINKGAVDDGIKSQLASIWTTFNSLVNKDPGTFTNVNKYLRGVQTFAPIEMVAVTVLISMYSDTRNHRLLLGDIQAMRRALRDNFSELRMNRDVWKYIWGYLYALERIRGAVDGSTTEQRQSRSNGNNTAFRIQNTSLDGPAPSVSPDSVPATTNIVPSLSTSDSANMSNITASTKGTPISKRKRIDPVAALRTPQRSTFRAPAAFPSVPLASTPSASAYFGTSLCASGSSNNNTSTGSQSQPQSSFDRSRNFVIKGGTAPVMIHQLVADQGQVPRAYISPYTRPNTTSGSNFASPTHFSVQNDRTVAIPGDFGSGRGAFTPRYSDKEWDGILSSTTAQTESQSGPSPLRQPSLESNLSKQENAIPALKRRSVPSNRDEVIDLTSDKE